MPISLTSAAPAIQPLCVRSLVEPLQTLADIVHHAGNLIVLTGAGISTDSGIPDYRSPGRPPYKPLQHADFLRNAFTRRRYWARSTMGYSRMLQAVPNQSHKILAEWESAKNISGIITQNVDRLHHKAGSKQVLELHGTIHEVECLGCQHKESRVELQRRIVMSNQTWLAEHSVELERPDGDVELSPDAYGSFTMPECLSCGQELLKPSVVFHGGNVPPDHSLQALQWVEESDALLVLGSSLTVWSAFRLVRAAVEAHKPIGIVSFGPTRADNMVENTRIIGSVKIEASVKDVLEALQQM